MTTTNRAQRARIRGAMIEAGVTLTEVRRRLAAAGVQVTLGYLSRIAGGSRDGRGPGGEAVRAAIAEACGRPEAELWPDDE